MISTSVLLARLGIDERLLVPGSVTFTVNPDGSGTLGYSMSVRVDLSQVAMAMLAATPQPAPTPEPEGGESEQTEGD